MTNCTDGYGAAVAFCVLLTLLSIAQFIVIGILIARLKGIKVENEIKKYALSMRNWIVDRFREFREIRESRTLAADNSNSNPNQHQQLPLKHDPKTSPTTRVPDFPGVNSQPAAQQPPAPYHPPVQQAPAPYHPAPVQQPPAPYHPPAPNDNSHKRTGSVGTNHQDQLIQSMAQLMKDGLKEVELKKEETAASSSGVVPQQTSKKPHPNKDIVFASYDMMVNETGQILDHCGNKPCDYEEPLQLLGSGGIGLEPAFTGTSSENRNKDVVVASYEVARENTDINDMTDEGYSLVEIPEELPTVRTSSQQLSHKYANVKVRRGSQH